MNNDNRTFKFEELFDKVLRSLPFQKQGKVIALSSSRVEILISLFGKNIIC